MANVLLPKIRFADEKGENEKQGYSSNTLSQNRRKLNIAASNHGGQGRAPLDSGAKLRIDGQGGGYGSQLEPKAELLAVKLDPQIAENVRWEDLKDKKKLTQNLHDLLLIRAIGIPVEITKSKGCHGAVVVPLFHCPRCLENWNRFKKLPTNCKEPAKKTLGLPVLIDRGQSAVLETDAEDLSQASKEAAFNLPSIDCDKASHRASSSIQIESHLSLQSISQKQEAGLIASDAASTEVASTSNLLPALYQGGERTLPQFHDGKRAFTTGSVHQEINDMSVSENSDDTTPAGSKNIASASNFQLHRKTATGFKIERSSELHYNNKRQRDRHPNSFLGDKETMLSQSRSVHRDNPDLSKTCLLPRGSTLEITRNSSAVRIHSFHDAKVAPDVKDGANDREKKIENSDATTSKAPFGASKNDGISEERFFEQVLETKNSLVTATGSNTEDDKLVKSNKVIQDSTVSSRSNKNRRDNKDIGSEERTTADHETKGSTKDSSGKESSSMKQTEIQNFKEGHSDDSKSVQNEQDEKATSIMEKIRERRKSIQSNIKNPAVLNKRGKPDTPHQPLGKHMMSAARGPSSTLTTLESTNSTRDEMGVTMQSNFSNQVRGSAQSRRNSSARPSSQSFLGSRGGQVNSGTDSSIASRSEDPVKDISNDYGIGLSSTAATRNRAEMQQSSSDDSKGLFDLPSIEEKGGKEVSGRSKKGGYTKRTRKNLAQDKRDQRKHNKSDSFISESPTSSFSELPPLYEIEDMKTGTSKSPIEFQQELADRGSVPFSVNVEMPNKNKNRRRTSMTSYEAKLKPTTREEKKDQSSWQQRAPVQERTTKLNSNNKLVTFKLLEEEPSKVSSLDRPFVSNNIPSIESLSLSPSPEPVIRKKVTQFEIKALEMMSFTSSYQFSYYDLPKPYVDYNESVKNSINSIGRRGNKRYYVSKPVKI